MNRRLRTAAASAVAVLAGISLPGAAQAATNNVSVYVNGTLKASIQRNDGQSLCVKVYHSTSGAHAVGQETVYTDPAFAIQATDRGGDDTATCVGGDGGYHRYYPVRLSLCFVGENGVRTCATGDTF